MTKELHSFDDLKQLLRGWSSFKDEDVYDFVGIWTLFLACLENMQANALEAELQDVAQAMPESQLRFLKEIATHAESSADSGQ